MARSDRSTAEAVDASLADEARKEEIRFKKQYQLESKAVGEGTYGAVYKATCLKTRKIVAIKKMKPEHEEEGVPSTAIREVAVLRNADHPNVVRLLDVHCSMGHMQLVFEFVDCNLKEYVRKYGTDTGQGVKCISKGAVRNLQLQLMRGIDYCHARRVIHRDLKPQNILVEEATLTLKVADFGMARAFALPMPVYTHEVVTTWYRAPEILFGSQGYSLPVDAWSAGCIMGELATGNALFRGDSEIDTIFHIFKKLGTPSEAEWPGLTKLPDFKAIYPQWKRRPWQEVRNTIAQLGSIGAQLLDALLTYDPRQRITARQALKHPYFADDMAAATPRPSPTSAPAEERDVTMEAFSSTP